MCGILCVLGVSNGAENLRPRVLERVRRLRHRGPDWSGVFVSTSNKHILAHERLAIVGVDSGAQPLLSEDKSIALAINGEIYNHKDLRKSFLKENHHFLTESDCEIILYLYKEHGHQFLNLLNGIFGFVLIDEKNGEFIIGRDHMGICPLYWGHDSTGAIWVSSEMKGLSDICIEFEDFPPGHLYSSKHQKLIKWYNPKWHDETYISEDKLDLPRLRHELENSVRRQLMTDVPYGVLLSGGLDSSLIASITSRLILHSSSSSSSLPSQALHSFSIGLVGSPDLAAAKIVANHLKTIHHEYTFTIAEGLNAISDVVYHLETYDVTTIRAATPMYLMSRKIKSTGVKMVLSGEGADEMFGGYLYFHKCPDRYELQKELVRKLKLLYKFDCLRANKSTSAWGVEARVPFLDKEFLDYCMNHINPQDKLAGRAVNGRIEKWCLRKAFSDLDYLPNDILWRQKEQFSDGVGYNWIDTLKSTAELMISDELFNNAKIVFPYNTPATKEAYYIRSLFHQHFPQESAKKCVPGGPSVACSTPAALLWDASFKKFADCSGRSVQGVHMSAYDDKRREEAFKKGEAIKDEEIITKSINEIKTAVVEKIIIDSKNDVNNKIIDSANDGNSTVNVLAA